jgi:FkbM family methyltransferase
VEILRNLNNLRAGLINRVGSVPIVGELLRGIAHRYPEGSVVTIGSGLAAGVRWKRRHRYVNGYWIGNYEFPIQQALGRLLGPGDVFYDLGANAGFFSMLAAKRVGAGGRVYAFEPLPTNITAVQEQIALNAFAHVTLVPLAVGASEGTAQFSFAPAGSSAVAHLGGAADAAEQTIEVKVTTLDAFARDHAFPTVLKIDVEGAEIDVLAGGSAVLDRKPRMLIELHGLDKGEGVVKALGDRGYTFERIDGAPAARPEAEPHLVALPPR